MSGAVAAYSGPSSALSTNHATARPTSQSTAGISWDAAVLRFADLPPEARRLAPDAGVLAEVVLAISGLAIKNGVATQKRLAFRSYATKAVVVTAIREMTKRSDGRYAPASPWSITSSQTLATANGAQATRRTGTIQPGRLATAQATESSALAPSRDRIGGVEAETYLPAEVRVRLTHEIPQPEIHLGELTQWQGRWAAATQEIVILRQSGAGAVVVKAVRPDKASAPWSVTQWSYTLASNARALSS